LIRRVQELWAKERLRVFSPYQKNDKVWLEAKNLKTTHLTTKLCPLRYGPFTIIEVLSPITYRLKLPPQWKIHDTFHASLLMPYKETDTHRANFPQPAPDLIDGQEEWEVEKVLDSRHKGRHKHLQYLLEWKGYSDADNMWEDANQVFAKDLISQFHKGNPKAIKVICYKEGDDMSENASSETSGPKQQRARLGIWTRNRLRGFPCVTRVTRCNGGRVPWG
jgi:Chromo (CHRromatin Organisation MOdifier) domain